jgi:hypothetical protein
VLPLADSSTLLPHVPDSLYLLWWFLAYLAGFVAIAVIAIQKGKIWMAACGLLLVPIAFSSLFLLPLAVLVPAAVRIAKPNSRWARRYYAKEPSKQKLAEARFPRQALKQS